MIMIDQSKRLSQPLRWTRAGRWVVVGVAGSMLAAIAIVAVVAVTGGSSRLHAGCIEVTFPSTLGAATIRPCGAAARTTCARPTQYPALAADGTLRDACRRAGLPYGTG